jgi:hypothetical protein
MLERVDQTMIRCAGSDARVLVHVATTGAYRVELRTAWTLRVPRPSVETFGATGSCCSSAIAGISNPGESVSWLHRRRARASTPICARDAAHCRRPRPAQRDANATKPVCGTMTSAGRPPATSQGRKRRAITATKQAGHGDEYASVLHRLTRSPCRCGDAALT